MSISQESLKLISSLDYMMCVYCSAGHPCIILPHVLLGDISIHAGGSRCDIVEVLASYISALCNYV